MSLCDGWLLREIGCIYFPSRLFCLQRSRSTSRCVGPHQFFSSGATVDAEIHLWSWSLLSFFYQRFYTSQDGDRQPRHRTIHPQISSFCSLTLQSKKSWIWHPKNESTKTTPLSFSFIRRFPFSVEKGYSYFRCRSVWCTFSCQCRWILEEFHGEGALADLFPPIEMHWCQRWAFYLCWMGKWVTKDLTPGTKASNACHAWYGWLGLGIFRQSRRKRSTVDGSEIRQTHQLRLVVHLVIYFCQGFIHFRWCRISSINSIATNVSS